jgi:hypothetical protein
MHNKFFTHLNNLPVLPANIIQEGLNCNFRLVSEPSRLYVGKTSFNETNFYKQLQNTFKEVGTSYRYTPANSIYDWHIDNKRVCAILWPIKNNSSAATFYRGSKSIKNIFYDLTEVDYTLYKPTLLNTTYEHCVINNYNEPRIVLSVSLFDISYEDAIPLLQNINCEHY